MEDDKNSFVATAALLTDEYHVILPELMGHGENTRDPSRDYSVAGFNVAEAYNQFIPNSELIVLNEAGHSPQLEKPEEVGTLILDFLITQNSTSVQ